MTLPPPQDRPEQWSQGRPQQQWSPGVAPGQAWAAGGQQHHAPPPAPSPGSSRTRNLLVGALAGIVVAALVVGGLTLANVVTWGSGNSSAVDTRAVELPTTLGTLTDVGTAAAAKGGSQGAAAGARYQRTYDRTAALYRTAYDGAGVGVRTYTNADLDYFLTVIAVRADSPGLVQGGPQADPADLGVAAQPNQPTLVVDGDVQCLQTVTQVVKEGDQIEDDDLLTTVCRTTSTGLTVYVFGGGGTTGTQGKQLMVDLTRAARSSIAGS